MANLFPFLVASAIRQAGCHRSVAEKIQLALEELPQDDSIVLWLRLQGRSYRDIGETLGFSRMKAYRVIHNDLRNSIYSVIERSTSIPVSAMTG